MSSHGTLPLAPGQARPRWRPPAADHPQRLALPCHLRPVAAALFDDLPGPPPAAAVDQAVAALEPVRAQLAAAAPAGTRWVVDAHRVRLAAGCAASVADDDRPFRWSPAAAARHLGLRSVALHLCGDGRRSGPAGGPPSVEVAVTTVMAELMDRGGERTPGPWLSELDDAGRAVAQAQARCWAEQAVAWLPLRLVHRPALRFLDDDWWPGGRGDRVLVVHGRRDVTIDLGGWRVAVTLAGGAASAAGHQVDALTALAGVLGDARGRLVRVVRVHPASGEVVATDVTPPVLERAVAVVGATAAAMAAAAAGRAVATPGPGCAWCGRRGRCQPGQAWERRPEPRPMGLPVRRAGPGR